MKGIIAIPMEDVELFDNMPITHEKEYEQQSEMSLNRYWYSMSEFHELHRMYNCFEI